MGFIMEKILFIPIIISFVIVLFSMKFWIKKAHQIGLVWDDMHKIGKQKIAGSGGMIVVMSFVVGVLVYVALQTFYFGSVENTISILALLVSVLLVAGIGLIDDLFGWQHGGLSMRNRLILVALASIPLVVINAGESEMLGIQFGLWYPLLFIPLGIVGASTTFNFLAGYNGLEAGQGVIILSALSLVTWLTGNSWLSLICLIMVVSLTAFYIFNVSPARIFPGDVLTYSVGAMIAIVAILGNIEKIAVFFFIPYIIEVGLKSRGRLKKSSFGKLREDGFLDEPYEKVYGLEHLAIRILKKIKREKKVSEMDVVFLIYFFQLSVILIGFLIFWRGLL